MSENDSIDQLSSGDPEQDNPSVKSTGFTPNVNPLESSGALQDAEKPNPEGGGGFNPRIEPTESERALAPEEHSPPFSPQISSFSAARLAPEVRLTGDSPEEPPFSPGPDSLAYTGILPENPPTPTPDEPTPGLLFQSWSQPDVIPQPRIPHFGHLCLLLVLALFGLLGTALLTHSALHFHLFGVSTLNQAILDIHYTLGSMAALYLLTLGASLLVFPLLWHESLFAGLQWRGETAFDLRRRLLVAAFVCFVLALVNGWLLPGPSNTPIEKLFNTPAAAWLMFGFGVTFAPFFEEIVFRGFLLPALCTTFDWIGEKTHGEPAPPLDSNGHPQWSFPAMTLASILTSVPFALMHAEQTGYALGPFLLLIGVSLVLCWARLSTRSLAASVLVHASYNFLLFSIMMVGTGGFRHMDKM